MTHVAARSVAWFNKCLISSDNSDSDINLEIHPEIQDLDEGDNFDERYELVNVNSYLALLSAHNSMELFHICEIKETSIATDDLVDFYGHIIQKGAKFLTVVYLEKKDAHRSNRIYYKKHKRCLHHPAEIFVPDVSIDDSELSMSLAGYQFLSDSI